MASTPSPTQSRQGSLASSPAQSQELQLTPRTRLRKLMSAFDDEDDSDKENHTVSAKKPSKTVRSITSQPLSSEREGPTSRPKMTAMVQEDSGESSDGDSADAGQTAYERIKKSLNNESTTAPSLPLPRTQHPIVPTDAHAADPASPSPAPRSSQTSRPDDSPLKISAEAQAASIPFSDSESEPEPVTAGRNRLQNLVAKKRAEREAREFEAQRQASDDQRSNSASPTPKKPYKAPKPSKRATVVVESEGSGSDNEAGRKFTSEARPTRKASKKAIEDMRRETQRISRNMQLAHEARTKTKYTTADLFKRMGFRQSNDGTASSSEAVPSSDAERRSLRGGTPPSSPPSLGARETPGPKQDDAAVSASQGNIVESFAGNDTDDEADAPSLEEIMRAASSAKIAASQPQASAKPSIKRFSKKRLALPKVLDDDLEIEKPRISRALTALDSIPERKETESKSLHALRALAHLNGRPGQRRNLPKSMTPTELQQLLQIRAREQVLQELAEKRQRMRDRGEEFIDDVAMEREQLETHELIERARKEDEELAKREKEAAKKAGKSEGDELPSDDEDEDYKASDEEAEAEAVPSEDEDEDEEQAFSGSEDEDEDEEQAFSGSEDELQPAQTVEESGADSETEEMSDDAGGGMFDDAAEEDDAVQSPHRDEPDQASHASASQSITPRPRYRHNRRAIVDSDDEGYDEAAGPSTDATLAAIPSTAPLKSTAETPAKKPTAAITAAFGFPQAAKSPALGLSQIFGGTMAGSQSQTQTQGRPGSESVDISPMIARNNLPAPQSAITSPAVPGWTQVMGSPVPPQETPSKVRSGAVASQEEMLDETQFSQMPAPTQDAGFEAIDSPVRLAGETQGTHSTVDTVLLADEAESSLAARQPRRIQRGLARTQVVSSQDEPAAMPDDVSDAESQADAGQIGSGNAFLVMKRTKQRAPEPYMKTSSKAKGMVEEQAEESEDEYAGLGGASDDESTGSLDDETRAMIDDVSNENINARRVAAAYNEQRLAEDEKATNKLFKDVTTGAWRRKRGMQDDLLEEDDEEEAIARRRAAKQREFARMRKALLADEAVGKIAQNPKREAFLRAIEDFGDAGDMDFLDGTDSSTQTVPATQEVAASAEDDERGQKRSFDKTDGDDAATERNARRRRTTAQPKPIPDIRRVLSDMLGEPEPRDEAHSDANADLDEDEDVLQAAAASDDEADDHRWTKPAESSAHPRRTATSAGRKAVIDRMALKRASSTSLTSATTSGAGNADRMAFNTLSKAGSGSGSFKVPSLLRRATTNASTTSETGAPPPAATAMGMGKEGVKMGGSKKSSVNYYVRETERRARVAEMEKSRREGNARVGRLRREAVGLGNLGGGAFE